MRRIYHISFHSAAQAYTDVEFKFDCKRSEQVKTILQRVVRLHDCCLVIQEWEEVWKGVKGAQGAEGTPPLETDYKRALSALT